MSCYKILIFILVIFLKTGNVLSLENIFNVNNIEITKKSNNSNDDLANKAIKKGFGELLEKILLKEDIKNLSGLDFPKIKELVSYYQIVDEAQNNVKDKVTLIFFLIKINYIYYFLIKIFLTQIFQIKNYIYYL